MTTNEFPSVVTFASTMLRVKLTLSVVQPPPIAFLPVGHVAVDVWLPVPLAVPPFTTWRPLTPAAPAGPAGPAGPAAPAGPARARAPLRGRPPLESGAPGG